MSPFVRRVPLVLATSFLSVIFLVTPALALTGMVKAYVKGYLVPRAFPDTAIADSVRQKAYEQLLQLRASLGVGHVLPRFADTAAYFGGTTTTTTVCAWRSIGPTNISGRVTSIAIDPNQRLRIFAATVGGIWRSMDGGRRWRRVTDNVNNVTLLAPARWASVALCSPSNKTSPTIVLAGSGDPNYAVSSSITAIDSSQGKGIWRSLSNGDPGTWFKVTSGLDGQVVFRIRIDPATRTVYAATSLGIYVGTGLENPSMSWSRLDGADPNKNYDFGCSDVVVDFARGLVYAGVYRGKSGIADGIWKHNGSDWERKMSGISGTGIGAVALAISAQNPDLLFARIANADDGFLHGLHRSTTGGSAWATVWTQGDQPEDSVFDEDRGGYSWYNNVVEIDPQDDQIVLTGGQILHLSTDGGTSWTPCSASPDRNFRSIHDDQHAIAFAPAGHLAMVGNDGGIDRSTDLSLALDASPAAPRWHWEHVSHGLINSELYALAGRQVAATALAAGSQDNGTGITFGNRTWYQIQDCDATSVAMDAQNSCTLYETCNGNFLQRANPVTGTPGSGSIINAGLGLSPPANTKLGPPYAADPFRAHCALASGTNEMSNRRRLLRTIDGKIWTEIAGPLDASEELTCMAIAPSSDFTVYYAGLRGSSTSKLGVRTGDTWSTSGAGVPTLSGGVWNTWTPSGSAASLSPNAIAVDYTRPERAFAVFGGATGGVVLMTNNRGASWTELSNVGWDPLPPLLGIAIDPTDPSGNTLFVGTIVTMLRAQLSGTTLTWTPFDEGLPDGVDVTDVLVNPVANLLRISTMGYGAYEREIPTAESTCPGAFLLVRDNVFDRGEEPSIDNEPDPEHPIPVPGGWYEPDNSSAGRLHWWSSTDIRVEVPDPTRPGNQVPPPGMIDYLGTAPEVDHVEMETCPLYHDVCAPGTMIDSNPEGGRLAKVRVQVSNQGLLPASNVRVMALWRAANCGPADLPSNFWTYHFPPNATSWPAYPAVTGWRAVDPVSPVRTITVVNPGLPEVTTFDWDVPAGASGHSCIMVIVESAADPIPAATRSELSASILVPNDRHIALRNIHIVGRKTAMTQMGMSGSVVFSIGNPTRIKGGIDLFVSRVGLPPEMGLDLELPAAWKFRTRGAEIAPGSAPVVDGKGRVPGVRSGKSSSTSHLSISAQEAVFEGLPVPPGGQVQVQMNYRLPEGYDPGGSIRFNVMTRKGRNVIGGNTFILRASQVRQDDEEEKPPRPTRTKE